MHMAIATREWTVEEVWALPEDGKRYEVIDGELFVTPSPRDEHQFVVVELVLRLQGYLRLVGTGRTRISPSDIRSGPRTMVQPDVFVVPLVAGKFRRGWNTLPGLLLAVEVLSPSSARTDRDVKRRLYQRAGIPEYWIVDVDAALIERWRSGDERPEIVTGDLAWQPDPAHSALVLNLPELFAAIPEEEQ